MLASESGEWSDELPKTISGKIRRVELRAAEAAHAGSRPDGEYREEDFS
jgi:acetyl-CoA synthetase